MPGPILAPSALRYSRYRGEPGGQEGQRVRPDQRLDDPEAHVAQAPDPDLPGPPPADEHPLGHNRNRAHHHKAGPAEHDRPKVDAGQARTSGDPPISPGAGQRDRPGIAEEEQQLQRPAHQVLRRAGFRRALGYDRVPRPDQGRHRVQVRLSLSHPERLRQAPDRRMPVDVLHRHRRQVRTLPDPRAELGHHQRIGTQIIEKVAINRHPLGAHHLGQDLGQDGFGTDRRNGGNGLDRNSRHLSSRIRRQSGDRLGPARQRRSGARPCRKGPRSSWSGRRCRDSGRRGRGRWPRR